MLLNLLSNAVKFTDRGSVSLRIVSSASQSVRFEVRDTGVGVPQDQLESIFELFEQVGNAERSAGGTGLGLAISRQFVRAMGGEIRVESEVGCGSYFWFELPPAIAISPFAPIASPMPVTTGYVGPRAKVLVIDDASVNRAVVVGLLDRLGFETIQAATGREGLAKVQSERPALIITDVVMPDMDGLEVTRHLRQMDGLSDTPAIAVSASASGSDEQKSRAAGVSAFMPKPIDFDRLLAQIATLLGLAWTYAVPASIFTNQAQQETRQGNRFTVPIQEMSELHRFARHGDMTDAIDPPIVY